MGKKVLTAEWHWSPEPAVASPGTSARETDLVVLVPNAAHDHANLIPAKRHRILNTDCGPNAQLREGSGMLVVATLRLVSSGGSA